MRETNKGVTEEVTHESAATHTIMKPVTAFDLIKELSLNVYFIL